MARTTLDIANPVLRDLKRLRKEENRPMGELVSELVAEALAMREKGETRQALSWTSQAMDARIDLRDKEAVWQILDGQTR